MPLSANIHVISCHPSTANSRGDLTMRVTYHSIIMAINYFLNKNDNKMIRQLFLPDALPSSFTHGEWRDDSRYTKTKANIDRDETVGISLFRSVLSRVEERSCVTSCWMSKGFSGLKREKESSDRTNFVYRAKKYSEERINAPKPS